MAKYTVHVERVVRLRTYKEWALGPYYFHWFARFIAWMQTYDTDDIWQSAIVVQETS